MICYVWNLERGCCPLDGAIGISSALLLQMSCINEGLILSVECISYPLASSENVLSSSESFEVSSIISAAPGGGTISI